ncbi:MAG: hypothetical protein ACOZF0_09180 [Thermodesulfobacteriota bacterium]
MDPAAIFIAKLQLLIIMSKAFMKGFPLGKFRREAILKNSEDVFYASLQMEGKALTEKTQGSKAKPDTDGGMDRSHLFLQRVQLLCAMTRAIAEDRLEGEYKVKALEENLEHLCKAITFNGQDSDIQFLKVA